MKCLYSTFYLTIHYTHIQLYPKEYSYKIGLLNVKECLGPPCIIQIVVILLLSFQNEEEMSIRLHFFEWKSFDVIPAVPLDYHNYTFLFITKIEFLKLKLSSFPRTLFAFLSFPLSLLLSFFPDTSPLLSVFFYV